MRRLAQTGALAGMVTLIPTPALDIWSSVLAVWFLAFIGLRLAASLRPPRPNVRLPRIPDGRLPVYTVIAALYREAASVAPLMQAIGALDYPREKLDVIIVIELDDLETRAALARLGPMPHVQILLAPRKAAHQAEGAELRAAVRARQLHRRVRRRRPSRSGSTPRRARRISHSGQ